jgi:hypothetical protein
MRTLLIATLSAVATLSGCVQSQPRSDSPRQPTAPQGTPQAQAPVAAPNGEAPSAAVPNAPAATKSNPAAPNAGKGASAAPPGAPNGNASAEKPKPAPTPPAPAKGSVAERPPAAAPTPAEPSEALAQPPATPTLDLAGLTQRLRDTNAIGVFTKLSLRNQVDDLLDQFRGFYKGEVKIPLPELRQRYELLLLKVVSLLQDADPTLANAITSSREAIWNILADPQQFSKI